MSIRNAAIRKPSLAGAILAGAKTGERVKVGVTAGYGGIIWDQVKKTAAADGIDVEVVVFSDYAFPDAVLNARQFSLG